MYINWEFAIRNRVSFYTWNYFHMQLRAESSETISHFRLQIPSQINSILSPVHSTQLPPSFWHTSKTDKQWISLSIHSLHLPFPSFFHLILSIFLVQLLARIWYFRGKIWLEKWKFTKKKRDEWKKCRRKGRSRREGNESH